MSDASWRRFALSNTAGYAYYRLYITEVNAANDMLISGLRLMGGTQGIFIKLPDGTSRQLSML